MFIRSADPAQAVFNTLIFEGLKILFLDLAITTWHSSILFLHSYGIVNNFFISHSSFYYSNSITTNLKIIYKYVTEKISD